MRWYSKCMIIGRMSPTNCKMKPRASTLLTVLLILFTPSALLAQTPETDEARAQVRTLFTNNQPKRAVALLQQQAFAGQPWAQVWLGTLYQQGGVVPKSLIQSVDWYAQAATSGHTEGQFRLANVFCNAALKGVFNAAKCGHWLNRASAGNHAAAQLQLAQYSYTNRFGLGDFAKAAQLAQSASKASDESVATVAKKLSSTIADDLKTINSKAELVDEAVLEKQLKRSTHTIRLAVFANQYAAHQFILNSKLKDLFLFQAQRVFVVTFNSFKTADSAAKALASLPNKRAMNNLAVVSWEQVASNLQADE